MALPTQYTAGYTLYAGKVSCVCLAAWLPWLERLALAHGYIKYKLDVLQLTGSYSLSGGTHSAGGVYDIKQYDTRIVALAREMGAPATWLRNMNYADGSPGNTHTHGVLSSCPHNYPAAYQITAQKRGYNGMGQGWYGGSYLWGYGGKDPHPDPSVYRTWQQGIEWAKAEIVRITGQNLIDNLETIMALSDADKVWLTALVEKRPWFYKNPDTTRDAYDYLRNPGLDVWDENFVTRDGEKVSMKQEVADIKTQSQASAGALASLSAKVDTLKDGVANLVTLIQESHPKPDPDPEPTPLPVPVTQYGVDVSGHQTLEQVKAACANPKYGFVIVKATEGLTFDSASYTAQMAAVRDAGLCAGAYHFAWPNQDPLKEAEHFARVAALKPGELACLDVENWPEASAATWTQRLAYTLTWLRAVTRLTGTRPLVYANWDWIKGLRAAATVEDWDELVTFPLWIAQYRAAGTFDTVSPKTGSANGWPVVIHQWTNNDGGLDGNYMPDVAAWATYAIPA